MEESRAESPSETLPESMVIYVQQEDGVELTVPVLASGSTLDQQVIALVQEGYDGGTEDDLASLPTSDKPMTLMDGGDEGEIVANLLGSVDGNEDFSLVEQRTGTFQTEDGQIVYVTYTVNPIGEECNSEEGLLVDDAQQRMILHVSDDGNTIVLPAEEELDLTSGGEYPQFTVDSVYSLSSNSSFVEETMPIPVAVEGKEVKDSVETKHELPFVEMGNRRRTEQVIGEELRLEERLEVLDAMLPPAPERARKTRREDGESGAYVCDLCGASFPRAAQYYGHLHSHSGERKWGCSACPGEVQFGSQSQLRRHEKQCHLNLRPHVCQLCPARFDRASQLSYHERRVHGGERPHSCLVCCKSFFKRSDLRTHLNIHLGLNQSICETCGKRFNHVSNLIRHTRMHSGVKPYPCTVCGRRFSQLNSMHQHKVSHQSTKDISCALCNKQFKSNAILRKHARHMHGDKDAGTPGQGKTRLTRRFYCKVCGESFEFSALLKGHESQHEMEDSFHCNCCGEDFGNMELMKNHSCQTPQERLQRAAEAEAQAERLSLNFQLESLLQEHSGLMGDEGELIIYVTQEGQTEPTEVHIKPLSSSSGGMKQVVLFDGKAELEGGGVPPCSPVSEEMLMLGEADPSPESEVSAATTLQLDLQLDPLCAPPSPSSSPLLQSTDNFMATCEEDLLELDPGSQVTALPLPSLPKADEPELEDRKKKVRVYRCPECPKSFLKNSNFKQHLGIHFIDQMSYSCPTCGQYFAWKSTLNKHVLRSHASVPPPRSRCDICYREYASSGQVQEHIKRDHYKHRPHSCTSCKKTFYKKNDLKIHLRTHTKERPYICGTCGKNFYHLSHIIRHERIHSGLRPYVCNECGRQFNQSSSLKSHRRRHVQNMEKHGLALAGLTQSTEIPAQEEFPLEQANILFLSGAI